MSALATALKQAGINVRPISDKEYKELCLRYPHKRIKTVRIPNKRPNVRDSVLPVSAMYGATSVRDSNGEPWAVKPDTTGQATFVAVA